MPLLPTSIISAFPSAWQGVHFTVFTVAGPLWRVHTTPILCVWLTAADRPISHCASEQGWRWNPLPARVSKSRERAGEGAQRSAEPGPSRGLSSQRPAPPGQEGGQALSREGPGFPACRGWGDSASEQTPVKHTHLFLVSPGLESGLEHLFPVVFEAVDSAPWSCPQWGPWLHPEWRRQAEGQGEGAGRQEARPQGLCSGRGQPVWSKASLAPRCGRGVEPHLPGPSQPPLLGHPNASAKIFLPVHSQGK